ncbi:conserved hypothetical protein [Ricinus communis]|uniref:Uncharacterized protein n=1 Tax=Ricinus communis TaxID=3988 RepID=B9RI15_RICCO|nr:conserved hypothetical protein [Ricinus communis]
MTLFSFHNAESLGKLNDGRVIAVKQLSVASHQGKSQFVTEIATISAVQHRNLAWYLHENNRELELVDVKLSDFSEEEVIWLTGVALLCTQTSPNLRPSMSRVVAMLSGDTEVDSVISKPGYLTGWKFYDSTFTSDDIVTKGTYTSFYNSTKSTSMVADAQN